MPHLQQKHQSHTTTHNENTHIGQTQETQKMTANAYFRRETLLNKNTASFNQHGIAIELDYYM